MFLQGKAAIVTGAASGQGRATAILAAARGAGVVCIDVADPAETVAEIRADGGTAHGLAADVRDAEAWAHAADLARRELGGVYLLANVAGICPGALGEADTVVDQTEDGWQRVLDVNLKGAWLGMRAVIPAMIAAGGGRIVNVASLAATAGLANMAAYTASKAGLVGLTRQAAMEYALQGIRVNAINPGSIDTPMNQDIPREIMDEYLQGTPLRRAGTVDEIAATIVFLASPEADFITGQALAVDGGWSIQG